MAAPSRKKPDSNDASFASWSNAPALGMLDLFDGQLALWRHNADLSQRLLRRQQDQMLAFWRTQFAQIERTLPQAEGSPMLFTPMIAAMKAAEQMGEAALVAQRDAIEAMRPH